MLLRLFADPCLLLFPGLWKVDGSHGGARGEADRGTEVPGGKADRDKHWIQMGPGLSHFVWASENIVSGGPQAQRLRK